MPRPRKYANDAEKQAAFRAAHPEIKIYPEPDLFASIDSVAGVLNLPRTEVVISMLKFALTNRDWKRLGLTHTKK